MLHAMLHQGSLFGRRTQAGLASQRVRDIRALCEIYNMLSAIVCLWGGGEASASMSHVVMCVGVGTHLSQPSTIAKTPSTFNHAPVHSNHVMCDDVWQVLGQMEAAGLPPGPRAYHSLIFAYVRAKLPLEALDVTASLSEQRE